MYAIETSGEHCMQLSRLLGDKMRLAIQPWGMGCIYLERGTVSNVDKARWICQANTLEAASPRRLPFLNGTKAPYGLTVM